jgi:hypothetical protein
MRKIDDEEEMDDRYHCVLIDLNLESPHKLKAKALLGLNPGVNLWSKIK